MPLFSARQIVLGAPLLVERSWRTDDVAYSRAEITHDISTLC